ncbi:MAG: hypothetical protein Q4E88_03625 [Coriobacteriia bacterium]|nr:hypothetical protein [Coriobacteriia bacterium]
MKTDDCDIDYDTMGYGETYFDTDIFEDTVKFDNGKEMCIAKECKEVILDTEITGVKDYSLRGFGVLEKVDILGQMYNESNLGSLAKVFYIIITWIDCRNKSIRS